MQYFRKLKYVIYIPSSSILFYVILFLSSLKFSYTSKIYLSDTMSNNNMLIQFC
jgi:hypothetical protein